MAGGWAGEAGSVFGDALDDERSRHGLTLFSRPLPVERKIKDLKTDGEFGCLGREGHIFDINQWDGVKVFLFAAG